MEQGLFVELIKVIGPIIGGALSALIGLSATLYGVSKAEKLRQKRTKRQKLEEIYRNCIEAEQMAQKVVHYGAQNPLHANQISSELERVLNDIRFNLEFHIRDNDLIVSFLRCLDDGMVDVTVFVDAVNDRFLVDGRNITQETIDTIKRQRHLLPLISDFKAKIISAAA